MSERRDEVAAALFGQPWAILPEALDRLILSVGESASNTDTATSAVSTQGKSAIIPIIGPIVPHAGWFDDIFGVISLDVLNQQLSAALADPAIGQIVLYINSPGGQATGIHEFATRVRMANQMKPVVAYVYGMAASAAYWIAASAGRIVADRTAEVGSIGVIYAWTDDTEAMKARGLQHRFVASTQSPNKYLDPNTTEGRAELQKLADELAEIFIGDVAAYRGVTRGRVANRFGKGRIVMAEPALAAGMVDEIGILEAILASDIEKTKRESAMKLQQYLPNPKASGKPKGRADDDEDEDKQAQHEDEKEKDEDEVEARSESGGGDDDDDDDKKEAKAEGDDEGDEEGDDGKKESKKPRSKASMTLDRFKAVYPKIFREACAVGARKERRRIQSVIELGVSGHDELVSEALFGAKPMQARDLAYAVTLEQNKAMANAYGGVRADAESACVATTPVPAGAAGSESAWEKRIVHAMSGGLRKDGLV